MKGNKVLIPLILFVVLIISACNLVPPGSEIEVEGDFAQNPVFSPKGGIYTQDSLTISITTPEPDAVILYSFNESIPLGLDSWVYAVQALNPTQLDSCATFFMNYEDGDSLGFTELIAIGNCYQVFYDLNETLPGGAYAWMYDLDGLNKQTVNTCVDMILNVDLTAEISENTPGMSECEDVFVVLNASANDFVDTNLYEGPITIYDNKHLSAVAIAPEMNPSDLITEIYIFDKSGPANIPPYVALTSPNNGAEITQGTNVNIQATASDSDGTVSRVEFYRDGNVLLGTDTSAPYQYSWVNAPVGTYTLSAKAFDNQGGSSVSDTISIQIKEEQIGQNNPPTVSMSSPSNGATFEDTDTIAVLANAVDSDGTISKVEIIVNGNVAEEITAYPYGYLWENPAPGQYIIGARAYDNAGASAISSPVVITVSSSDSCQIDNDCQGDLICENGACIAPPYECNLDSDCETAGEYCAEDKTCQPIPPDIINCGADIQCFIDAADTCSKAKLQYEDSVDLLGVITSSSIYAEIRGYNMYNKCVYYQRTDSVNVEITDERIQQMVSLGLLEESEIQAYIKQLNDVAKENEGVEFLCSFNKDDLVAMLTRWSEGSFTGIDLTVAQCSQEHLNVEPTIHIINPGPDDREIEQGDSIILIARAEDTDGEIESVEFLIDKGDGYASTGLLYSEPYTRNIQGLDVGVYTIYAKAIDDEGGVGRSLPIVITVTEKEISTNLPPQVSLTNIFNNDKFLTTEGISLSADARDSDGSIAKVEFFATGTSTVRLATDTSEPYEYLWEESEEGSYTIEAKATDDKGATTYSQEKVIDIIEPKLLLNAEPSWIVYDENETEVTCISNLKDEEGFKNMNAEIKLYRNGTEVANGTNEVSEGKINLEKGTYNYMCNSTTYPFVNVQEDLIVRDGIIPPTILFDFSDFDEYPDWASFSKEQFKSLAGLRFRNKYGGIFYQDIISITRNIDLRGKFEISKYKVRVDSKDIPEFNKRAKIEFYNVTLVKPVPMKNGKKCSGNDCEDFTHNKTQKQVNFYVDDFSTYTIQEEPYCGDDVCDDNESYQSCAADCEKPDPDTRGWCHPNWECGDYGVCRSDGYQIRKCIDIYSCNSIKDMPQTYQRCGPSSIKTAGDNPQPIRTTNNNNQPAPYVPPQDDIDIGSSPQAQEPYSPPVYNENGDANGGTNENEQGLFSKYWWVLVIIGVLIAVGVGLFFFFRSKHDDEEDTTSYSSDTSSQTNTQSFAGTQQQYATQQANHGLTDDSLRSGVDFVKKMIVHGKTPNEVRNSMKSAGWTDVQLDAVFSKLNK